MSQPGETVLSQWLRSYFKTKEPPKTTSDLGYRQTIQHSWSSVIQLPKWDYHHTSTINYSPNFCGDSIMKSSGCSSWGLAPTSMRWKALVISYPQCWGIKNCGILSLKNWKMKNQESIQWFNTLPSTLPVMAMVSGPISLMAWETAQSQRVVPRGRILTSQLWSTPWPVISWGLGGKPIQILRITVNIHQSYKQQLI